MKEEKNEKWLDDLIAKSINTGKPHFNAEKWKQKFPDEFKILTSRAGRDTSTRQPKIWQIIFKRPITKFAAVITAITVSAVLVFSLFSMSTMSKNRVKKIDTSPYYILYEAHYDHLKETRPCNILPPFTN